MSGNPGVVHKAIVVYFSPEMSLSIHARKRLDQLVLTLSTKRRSTGGPRIKSAVAKLWKCGL